MIDEYGERVYSDDEMLELRGHKFLMDEDGNRNYTDKEMMEYITDDVRSSANVSSIPSFIDRIQSQINEFNVQCDLISNSINDINNKLINDLELVNYTNDVDSITKTVREMDENVKVINADIRLFYEMYGDIVDFEVVPSDLVDKIVNIKNNLKSLKMVQVVNYNVKVDAINKRIVELKNINDDSIDFSVREMINNLNIIEKEVYEVTDWKYGKHKNINYDEIKKIVDDISLIEEKIKVDRKSLYDEKIDGINKDIEDKIERIDVKITDNMSLDDVNEVRQDLVVLEDQVHNFETNVSLSEEKSSGEQQDEYEERIKKIRDGINALNKKFAANRIYKGIHDELLEKLRIIKVKLDSLLRYVDIHYGNANDVIVSYDKSELDSIERELKEVKRDILVRENQLIRSQYDRLLEVVVELENNINIVKRKLNDEGMLKGEDKLLVVINNINEINDGLNEVEVMLSNFGGRINSDESKLIDDVFGHLKFKISDAEVVLNNNRNDSRYEKLSSDIANCKERLYDLSGKSKKNRPLKVKSVKSGKKLLEKHNKLLLVSAGLIALTLLLRKFLLIPSIIHANVILGTANPSLLATTEFFNKILGGMIGARLNSSGIWFMSNGMMLTSSVATTSLLKGLVVGFTGTAVSLVPVLIVAIKELVEKMKIKERKLKLSSKNVMVDEGEKQEESMQQKLFNIKNNIIRGINNLKNDEMNVIDELHNGRSR